MVNIYIGHRKRQGKDTFAKMLKEELGDEAIILSFASPIKELVANTLGVSVNTLEDWKNDNVRLSSNTGEYNINIRDMIINFGRGEKTREYFSDSVWIDLAFKRAKESGCKYAIISDFRYQEEYLKSIFDKDIEQTITVKIERDHKLPDNRADKNLQDFNFNRVVENTGTLEELRAKAKEFIVDYNLQNNKEEAGQVLRRKIGF